MKSIIDRVRKTSNTVFITNLSLIALLFLWYTNPNNKEILAVFFIYCLILYFKTRDINLSLLSAFLTSSIIFTGKTHEYQLLDLKSFPYLKNDYPLGYVLTIIIKTSDIFVFAMFLLVLNRFIKIFVNRDRKEPLRNWGLTKLNAIDVLLIALCIVGTISSIVASKNAPISLYLTIGFYEVAVLNFFLKINNKKNYYSIIRHILFIIVIFQGFVALSQFLNSSPLGKSIELTNSPEKFGDVADEYSFVFRPVGTFFHSNDLGSYVASIIPLLIGTIILDFNELYFIGIIFGIITVTLTLSRSAWIGLLIALLYYLYFLEYKLKVDIFSRFKKHLIILFLILLPLVIYVAPRIAKTAFSFDDSGGMNLRIKQITETLNLVGTSPFFGVGNGMSVIEAIARNKRGVFTSFPSPVHNYYFLTLVEEGMLGLLILSLIIIFTVKALCDKLALSSQTNSRTNLYSLIAGIIVLAVSSFFQPLFHLPLLIIYYHLKDAI